MKQEESIIEFEERKCREIILAKHTIRDCPKHMVYECLTRDIMKCEICGRRFIAITTVGI